MTLRYRSVDLRRFCRTSRRSISQPSKLRVAACEGVTSGQTAKVFRPPPGHTRGSVVFLLDETYLFTGDSLACSHERRDLQAFHDACCYSWAELKISLARLAGYQFEWVLAGHGGSARLPVDEMRERLCALVERM